MVISDRGVAGGELAGFESPEVRHIYTGGPPAPPTERICGPTRLGDSKLRPLARRHAGRRYYRPKFEPIAPRSLAVDA